MDIFIEQEFLISYYYSNFLYMLISILLLFAKLCNIHKLW